MCGTTQTTESSMKTLNPAVARVLKRLHYPLDAILTCVRWYVAYPLSLRHLEDMMAERGVSVDHSIVHSWAVKRLPVLETPVEISQQPGRAGPSGDQATNATQARVPKFPLCPDPYGWHRTDAHDRGRADEVCSRNPSVRC
jgi:hypothetical protein